MNEPRDCHTKWSKSDRDIAIISLTCIMNRWLSGKEPACQCRRCRFNPWVRKIPRRRKWQSSPVSCLENPMDRGVWRAIAYSIPRETDMTEWLNNKKAKQGVAAYTNIYLLHKVSVEHLLCWGHSKQHTQSPALTKLALLQQCLIQSFAGSGCL